MSEVTYDSAISNLEIKGDIGIRLTSTTSSVKHTGTGTLNVVSTIGKLNIENTTNTSSDSIIISSALGGVHIQGGDSIKIGTSSNIPITIGNSSSSVTIPGSAVFTTLNATGGGALTGTWTDLGTVTTIDINGGSIDGTTIGANTPAAGTFSTLNATGSGSIVGKVTITGNTSSGGQLILREQTTGGGTDAITIKPPATLAASYTLTLPIDDGDNGEILSTDGNGILSWTTNVGGGGALSGTTLGLTNDLSMNYDSGTTIRYIYLNNTAATTTNKWRIYVDSAGDLQFERYDGAAWISKMKFT